MTEPTNTVDQDKAKLRELLNKAHTLRNSQRSIASPRSTDITRLKELAEECLTLSTSLNMEHGKGLSLEMLAYGKVLELDSKYMETRDAPRTDEEKETIKKQYLEQESSLVEAQQIGINYGDAHLVTRVLELLANIYRRADQIDKEIITIEKAVKMSRTVPKVMALVDAYQRMINFLFENNPDNADLILKFHTHYWENYLWLKDQPNFERDQFIHNKRVLLYKVAIYIGSIAGNPLNLGEQNPENFGIATEAYDEAIYIATVLQNPELLCAAHAHKALMLLPKLSIEEKQRMIGMLISLEETYHPTSSELRDIIDMLRQQLSSRTSS